MNNSIPAPESLDGSLPTNGPLDELANIKHQVAIAEFLWRAGHLHPNEASNPDEHNKAYTAALAMHNSSIKLLQFAFFRKAMSELQNTVAKHQAEVQAAASVEAAQNVN